MRVATQVANDGYLQPHKAKFLGENKLIMEQKKILNRLTCSL
jgi:hypothetical protein